MPPRITVYVDAHPLTLFQKKKEPIIKTQRVQVGRDVQIRRVKTGEKTTQVDYEPEHGTTKEQVRAYLDGANGIWNQASISFKLRTFSAMRFELPESHTMKGTVDSSAFDMVSTKNPAKLGFRLFLVRSLKHDDDGDMGLAARKYGVCAVAKHSNVAEAAKTLAHELGHLLGLEHYSPSEGKTTESRSKASVLRQNNLMAAGLIRGKQLQAWQVTKARQHKPGQGASPQTARRK